MYMYSLHFPIERSAPPFQYLFTPDVGTQFLYPQHTVALGMSMQGGQGILPHLHMGKPLTHISGERKKQSILLPCNDEVQCTCIISMVSSNGTNSFDKTSLRITDLPGCIPCGGFFDPPNIMVYVDL